MRYVGGVSQNLGAVKALAAGQAYFADGPFDHPQDFSRYNAYTKFSLAPSPTTKTWLSASVYDGEWHGSGQIPLREVSAGRLDRFGSIDPTEGGHSDREDLTLHYDWMPTALDTFDFLAYGSRYKLQLFSDFTFFKDTGLRFDESPDGGLVDTETGRFVGFDDRPIGHAGFVPGDAAPSVARARRRARCRSRIRAARHARRTRTPAAEVSGDAAARDRRSDAGAGAHVTGHAGGAERPEAAAGLAAVESGRRRARGRRRGRRRGGRRRRHRIDEIRDEGVDPRLDVVAVAVHRAAPAALDAFPLRGELGPDARRACALE